jgi:hypothetical protein
MMWLEEVHMLESCRHKRKMFEYQSIARAEIRKSLKNRERVEEALRILARRGAIHHFYRCDPDGELEKKGFDFLIYLDPVRMVPLRVKSTDAEYWRSVVEEDGRYIPCVTVNRFMVSQELTEKILAELNRPITPVEHRDDGFRNTLTAELTKAFEREMTC